METTKKFIVDFGIFEDNFYKYENMLKELKKNNGAYYPTKKYKEDKNRFLDFVKSLDRLYIPEYIKEVDFVEENDKEYCSNIIFYKDTIDNKELLNTFIKYYKKVRLRMINLNLKYIKASKVLSEYVKEDRLDEKRFSFISEKLSILSSVIGTQKELLDTVHHDIMFGNGKNNGVLLDFLKQSIDSLEPEYTSIMAKLRDNRLEEFTRLNIDPLAGIETPKHNKLSLALKM